MKTNHHHHRKLNFNVGALTEYSEHINDFGMTLDQDYWSDLADLGVSRFDIVGPITQLERWKWTQSNGPPSFPCNGSAIGKKTRMGLQLRDKRFACQLPVDDVSDEVPFENRSIDQGIMAVPQRMSAWGEFTKCHQHYLIEELSKHPSIHRINLHPWNINVFVQLIVNHSEFSKLVSVNSTLFKLMTELRDPIPQAKVTKQDPGQKRNEPRQT